MKVHLIKSLTIRNYVDIHNSAESTFLRWMQLVKAADWESVNDIRRTFPSADLLGRESDRIVFNIGGNKHRMICQYNFGDTMIHLYVNWIGTHAEYTKLCLQGKQYSVDNY